MGGLERTYNWVRGGGAKKVFMQKSLCMELASRALTRLFGTRLWKPIIPNRVPLFRMYGLRFRASDLE